MTLVTAKCENIDFDIPIKRVPANTGPGRKSQSGYAKNYQVTRPFLSALTMVFLSPWPTLRGSNCRRYCEGGTWEKVGGNPSWLRLTEQWTPTAKSLFLFDVQGAVAKSTFAGLPWLRYLRQQCKIHFWPFAGWDVPPGRSVRRLFAGMGILSVMGMLRHSACDERPVPNARAGRTDS